MILIKQIFSLLIFSFIFFWHLCFNDFRFISRFKFTFSPLLFTNSDLERVQLFLVRVVRVFGLKNSCFLIASTLFLLSPINSRLVFGKPADSADDEYHCWLIVEDKLLTTAPSTNFESHFEIVKNEIKSCSTI